MKNIKLTILLFSFFAFFSCKDDKPVISCQEVPPAYTLINVITGMDFFDANGSPLGRWGFPNDKKGEVLVYPIPSTGVLSLSSQNAINRIWLVPVDCTIDSTTANITMLSQNLNFDIAAIENVQIKDFPVPSFNQVINVNFEDVPTGMYRLFYQLGAEEIFWYNLYIDPSATNFPDFDFMVNGCN